MACPSKKLVRIGAPRQRRLVSDAPEKLEPPKTGDFHCADCGLTLAKRQEDHPHVCRPRSVPRYQTLRLEACSECECSKDNVCVKYKEQYPDRDAKISEGVKIPYAECPEKKWHRVMIRCPECDSVLFDELGVSRCRYCKWSSPKINDIVFPVFDRYEFPDGCAVITATDDKYLMGTYVMAWTLLRANDCRVVVYHNGLEDSQMVDDMVEWGVEFKQFEPVVSTDIAMWQTWQKPAYLLDALKTFDRILWIDGDMTIAGSLEEALSKTLDTFFIANHGDFRFHYEVPAPVRNYLGKIRVYQFGNTPCAGFLGASRLNMPFIREWLGRIMKLMKRMDLVTTTQYQDQCLLLDILECDLQDGDVWNYVGANIDRLALHMRGITPEPSDIMKQTYKSTHRRIIHYGGSPKYWDDWRELSFTDPREAHASQSRS